MSTGRTPKRARKKDRRAARREAYAREYYRRRRQRRIVLLGTLAVAVIVGLIAFFVMKPAKKHVAASRTPKSTTSPCSTAVPPAAKTKKPEYSAVEDQSLDASKTYIWRLDTSCGKIDIALDVTRAPKTSNSIVFLTRKHFYDGLFFHRNIAGFMIQGGDPLGTGTGGSGYKVVEAPPPDLKYDPGIVAMAKGGQEADGTSGSQFFIMVGNSSPLPPQYALVGKVVDGLKIAQEIVAVAPGEPPTGPTTKIYINSATIVEQ